MLRVLSISAILGCQNMQKQYDAIRAWPSELFSHCPIHLELLRSKDNEEQRREYEAGNLSGKFAFSL